MSEGSAVNPVLPGEEISEEDVMLAIMDAGGEDILSSEGVYEVVCPVESFDSVKRALDEADMKYNQATLAWIPQNLLQVEGGDIEKILKLLEDLEDLDDVQKVFSNFDAKEEELAKLLA